MFVLLWERDPRAVRAAVLRGDAPAEICRMRELHHAVVYLTNRTMSQLREAVFAAGVLLEEPAPTFPDPARFGVALNAQGDFDREARGYRAYEAACERVWRTRSRRSLRGLPSFKLESADGWLIHPAELAHVVDALDKAAIAKQPNATKRRQATRSEPLPGDLLQWLRAGITHGGVRVL
jgi:hypothetical protein